MILYFDSYITDTPLPGGGRKILRDDIRKNNSTYQVTSKIDIAKYTLASYSYIPWSYVFIRYELDDPKKYRKFDRYIRGLFPKAVIIHKRSDSQKDYIYSYRVLRDQKDDWIFYAPNNDMPLITADMDFNRYINNLIDIAIFYKKKYKYVSILYAFFSEYLNLPINGTPMNLVYGRDSKLIGEDKFARYFIKPKGLFDSIQIVDKKLFKDWFTVKNMNKRIIRAEDVADEVEIRNHLVIAPKKELCFHFDGYEHTVGTPHEIQLDRIPPLFIPVGFFSNSIKIAYGYDASRRGFVNINPKVKHYSFRDNKYGTDLKLCLKELPLFWRDRIKYVSINKKADMEELEKYCEINKQLRLDPWVKLPLSLNTFKFYLRIFLYKLLLRLGVVAVIGPLQKKHRNLFYIIRSVSI